MKVAESSPFSHSVFKRLVLQTRKNQGLLGKELTHSHNKTLDQTKLKAFADDKLNVTKMMISVFDRVENIVEKGEIAGSSNFSFTLDVFKRLLSQTHQKMSLFGNGLALYKLRQNFRLLEIKSTCRRRNKYD